MRFALVLLVLVPSLGFAQRPDARGCKDPQLFTRMAGYVIHACKDLQFDGHKFRVGAERKVADQVIEGHVTQTIYQYAGAGSRPSRLQVLRNYQNAAKALGGEVLHDADGKTTLRLARDGKELWSEVSEYGGAVTVWVVEREAMKQEVVADAAALANDLAASGHASVYGILFDTGLAVVKPESKPALQEIAKLLAGKPGLKLRLVGHTDAVGGLESNLRLSQARAEATLAALVSGHGVDGARVSSHGVGPLAPVATNATEEGRAKNRRVELVAW